jgi:outer membrane lipoprotein-sorting protein
MEDRTRQVLVEVTPQYRIARILIDSTDDSITEYRFSNQKENVPVLDGKFRFSAPAGSEVIDDETE